ncbi:MAG: DUF885 domain-containing protein [Pseudomonadota bacterium]
MKNVQAALLATLLLSAPLAANEADKALETLFAEERAYMYEQYPQLATSRGVHDYNNRLASVTPEAYADRTSEDRRFLRTLNRIDRDAVSPHNRLNYDLFEWMVMNRLESASHRTWLIPFMSDSGFHSYLPTMWRGLDFKTAADYKDYIARLRDVPRFFNEHMANMRTGMQEGITMASVVMPGFTATVTDAIVENAEDTAFWTPFKNLPDSMPEQQQEKIRAAGRDAIEQHVMPAYSDLSDFFLNEYGPAARETIGITEVPGGEVYYESLVRYYTTIDITAREVHETGLAEVARIRSEMEAIIREVEFEGDFAEFLVFLRTDPQFYAKTARELLMHASYLSKKADGKLPAFFKTLPRQPYTVEPVPDHLAPNYTTGRYVGGPVGGTRPGAYWVNTYQLDRRPLYNLTALTLHEAVPGHHLQNAISKEQQDVPAFRIGMYPHAFGEGWGLYSEKLGVEMDMYETPYDHFGRLSYEMWRACRLVVDTGMHAMGWTRDEAVALMRDNSALSLHNINTEVDRYISWPGQALAYKMGELTIWRLRAKAEAELGANFDLREFHDAVLSGGGLPLNILEQRIDEWVDERQRLEIAER